MWTPDELSPGFVKRGRRPRQQGYRYLCPHREREGQPELKCVLFPANHFVQCEACGYWHLTGKVDYLGRTCRKLVHLLRAVRTLNCLRKTRRQERESMNVPGSVLGASEGEAEQSDHRGASAPVVDAGDSNASSASPHLLGTDTRGSVAESRRPESST